MKQSPWDWKKLEMRLQALMDAATASGEECGCQLAIYWNGQQVLSLVSGYTTPERSVKIDEQSLFPVFSVGKGIMATAFHRLREKGKISCDTRVADLWPEFGCCGKENIRVRDILTFGERMCERQFDCPALCRASRRGGRSPASPAGNGGGCRCSAPRAGGSRSAGGNLGEVRARICALRTGGQSGSPLRPWGRARSGRVCGPDFRHCGGIHEKQSDIHASGASDPRPDLGASRPSGPSLVEGDFR